MSLSDGREPTGISHEPNRLKNNRLNPVGQVVDRLTKRRLTPLERFSKDLDVWNDILMDKGVSVAEVAVLREGTINGFSAQPRSVQIETHYNLTTTIDSVLSERYSSAIPLALSLDAEEGRIDNEPEWDKLFKGGGRQEKLDLVRDIEAENRRKLIARFDGYLSLWKKHLLSIGETPGEVEQKITREEDRFINASDFGRAGISRGIRERLETADSARFDTLLYFLKTVTDPERFPGELQFATREEYLQRFRSAGSPQQRQEVIAEVQRRIDDAIGFHNRNYVEPTGEFISKSKRRHT